jgi:hypothetical protein
MRRVLLTRVGLIGLGMVAMAGLAGCQKKEAATGDAAQTAASSPPALASAPVGPPHRRPGLWLQDHGRR